MKEGERVKCGKKGHIGKECRTGYQYNPKSSVKPLTELTKGGSMKSKLPFSWWPAQQQAFEDLKRAFQEAPILAQFNPSLPTLLETDASNQCSVIYTHSKGAILTYK